MNPDVTTSENDAEMASDVDAVSLGDTSKSEPTFEKLQRPDSCDKKKNFDRSDNNNRMCDNSDENDDVNEKLTKTHNDADKRNQENASNSLTPRDDPMYLKTDMGPFYIHLTALNQPDGSTQQDLHDVSIGLKLKGMKVKGISEVKKISRREEQFAGRTRNQSLYSKIQY